MQTKNIRAFKKLLWGIGAAFFLLALSIETSAQNMPYSQRGIGDPIQSKSILNKAMGGVSEAYSDAQTLNFSNPASYANLRLTTLTGGFNAGNYNLHNQDTGRFRSGFGSLSYLGIGVPLKKSSGWGLVFGLTPQTKINYKISSTDTIGNIGQRALRLYEGSGGAYKAFVGTGYGFKGFRMGINVGYLFGTRKSSIETVYPNDSSSLFNSHSRSRTGYGSFFVDAGIQADLKLSKGLMLKLGASGGLENDLQGKRDYLLETFNFTGNTADQSPKNQDTAVYIEGEKGTIIYPAHYGLGFLLQSTRGNGRWSIGADYETEQWSAFKIYGKDGGLRDNQTIRVGAQFVPSTGRAGVTSFWERVAYRVGYYYMEKNFKSNHTGVNEHAFTLGFGLPARNHVRSNEFTLINLGFEFGKRGTPSNKLNASFFRFSVGFSFSDIWFIERKYQ